MIRSKRNFLVALFGATAVAPTFKFPTPANVHDHLKCCWSWYEAKEILNALPSRKNTVASRDEDSFTVLCDAQHRDLIRLNRPAAQIWEMCNGRNSVDAMVRTITEDYAVSPDSCATDVILTLREFKRKGLISC